jgi:hypothetical protein
VADGCVTVVWRVVVVDWVAASSDAHEVNMTLASVEKGEIAIVIFFHNWLSMSPVYLRS